MGWIKDLIEQMRTTLDAANIDSIKFKYGIPVKFETYPSGFVALRPGSEMPIEPASVGMGPQAGKLWEHIYVLISVINRHHDEKTVDQWAHEKHLDVIEVWRNDPSWTQKVSDSVPISRLAVSDMDGDFARSAMIITFHCRKRT